MKLLTALSAAALLVSVSMGGVGCASNPSQQNPSQAKVAPGEVNGGNQQPAGYHQSANQSRTDTGNGAFGEAPP